MAQYDELPDYGTIEPVSPLATRRGNSQLGSFGATTATASPPYGGLGAQPSFEGVAETTKEQVATTHNYSDGSRHMEDNDTTTYEGNQASIYEALGWDNDFDDLA